MPPTMMVTSGPLAAELLLLELPPELLAPPALAAPDEPEALLAQAAIVVAARSAAPTALMRLVFMNSPLSFTDCCRGMRDAGWSRRGWVTRWPHLRASVAAST